MQKNAQNAKIGKVIGEDLLVEIMKGDITVEEVDHTISITEKDQDHIKIIEGTENLEGRDTTEKDQTQGIMIDIVEVNTHLNFRLFKKIL